MPRFVYILHCLLKSISLSRLFEAISNLETKTNVLDIFSPVTLRNTFAIIHPKDIARRRQQMISFCPSESSPLSGRQISITRVFVVTDTRLDFRFVHYSSQTGEYVWQAIQR